LTIRDVAKYAELSISTISDIENGKAPINEHNHKCITSGINKAFFEKVQEKNNPEKDANDTKNTNETATDEKASKIKTVKAPVVPKKGVVKSGKKISNT
jgi:transcriptional regulator with XRE-family HTH domain